MFSFSHIYVLAVGVNNTLGHKGQELKKTNQDVSHFLDHIRERFPDACIEQLLNDEAICNNIEKAVSEINLEISNNCKPEDNNSLFIFYFTGHGTLKTSNQGGEMLITPMLVTHDASIVKAAMQGGLPLSSDDNNISLFSLLSQIPIRKIAILDTCHGCAQDQVSIDHPPKPNSRIKGIKLINTQNLSAQIRGLSRIIKNNIPEDCWIVSACKIDSFATEGEDGSDFTNAFLQSASRSYSPEIKNNPWIQENPIVLDRADEMELATIIGKTNETLEERGLYSAAHITPQKKTLQFPLLIDNDLPLRHNLDTKKIGFAYPLTPKQPIRTDEIDEIEKKIKDTNKNISSFIVRGPSMTGKSTVIASVCEKLCFNRNDPRRLAWITLEEEISSSYILPFICYHMDSSPEGMTDQLAALANEKDKTLDIDKRYKIVAKLINDPKHKGIVVFDNADMLFENKNENINKTRELIKYLIKNVNKGKIILICT